MKALMVMVPTKKEESAKTIISETFTQKNVINDYRKYSDCYVFINNHREHKNGNMKTIFDTIVKPHEFREHTI